MPFCWFCHEAAHIFLNGTTSRGRVVEFEEIVVLYFVQ